MSPPPINLGGITPSQANVLTAQQLNAIIKPITGLIKSQASFAKSSTSEFVKASGRGVGNVGRAFSESVGGREGAISTAFDDSPIMNAIGDMLPGGKKEKEAEEAKKKEEEEKKKI